MVGAALNHDVARMKMLDISAVQFQVYLSLKHQAIVDGVAAMHQRARAWKKIHHANDRAFANRETRIALGPGEVGAIVCRHFFSGPKQREECIARGHNFRRSLLVAAKDGSTGRIMVGDDSANRAAKDAG